ncbi:MAG: hypothetical protein ABIF04_02910 [Chloroflexota bacterium]
MITRHQYTPFRKPAIAMSLTIVLALLAGCNLPIMQATPSPTAISLPPLNTDTPIPPTPTLTLTSTPTTTATPSATDIVFFTGTTAGVVQGTIQPNQVLTYTLSAGQYQPMILILNSSNNGAYLAVSEPDGNALLDPAKKWTNWQWLLPKTEVYTIQVIGGTTAENFTLTAKVAKRVTFPAGGSSITLDGTTPKGYVFSYAISCKANQTMTISLNVPATSAYLDIFGLATGTLLSSSTKATTWTGTLPATEDYIIEVIPNNGQVVNYSLTVTVN